MNTKAPEKTENKSKELVIDLGLNDKAIDELGKKYLHLKLQGPDDKEGYTKIVEYRKDTKDHRLAVIVAHKKEKAFYLEGGRQVDAEKNRLLDLLAPIENHLIEQENIVKNELARVKAEKEQKIEEVYQARLLKVIAAGAVFNGTAYIWDVSRAGPEGIRMMTDEEFLILIERIKLWREKEDARISDEAKAKKEEEDRQAKIAEDNERIAKELAEKQAEQDKKDREQKEQQDKIDREFKEQQDKIAKENADKEAELKRKEDAANQKIKEQQDKIDEDKRIVAQQKTDVRKKELIAAGAVFGGEAYCWPGGQVFEIGILECEDLQWDRLIVTVKEKVKAEADQEAKDAQEKQIADKKKQDQAIEDAKKKATEDAEKEVKLKAQEKSDKEKKDKLAAEKKAKLAPDKEKLYAFSKALFEVPLPDLKSPEAKDFFKPLHTEFVKIIQVIREKSKS